MIKTEFIELYEELNSLNEAASPEAQDFYKSINNKYKNLVDTESFIKAFKKDIPDDIWNKLFDDDMKFKNRGTYGIIKNEPLPAEVTAALKKYWAYQFASNIGSFKTTTMLAKEEAERKRKVDERHAKVKADQEKAERVINLIDEQALDKLTQLVKEFDPDKLDNGPVIHTRTDGVTINGSAVYVSFYTIKVWMATDATEQELADEFNKDVLAKIQELEKIKTEKLAKQTRQEKYKNAKWYSEELEEWIVNDYKATYLFQLPDDEGVQKIVKATWDKIERCHFTDDVELIAVIVDLFTEKSNPHSTTQSEYRNIYYSVNSEGNHAETLKAEDIVLDPTKFKPTEQYLVNDSYYEISAENAKNDSSYFKAGMNQWFHNAIIYYGTD